MVAAIPAPESGVPSETKLGGSLSITVVGVGTPLHLLADRLLVAHHPAAHHHLLRGAAFVGLQVALLHHDGLGALFTWVLVVADRVSTKAVTDARSVARSTNVPVTTNTILRRGQTKC